MKKRRTKETGSKKLGPKQLEKSIYRAFVIRPKKRLNAKDLQKILKVKISKDKINHHLEQLADHQQLIHIRSGRYKLNKAVVQKNNPSKSFGESHIGKLDLTRSGSGFVIVDQLDQDIFIHEKNINGAYDRDVVKVGVIKSGRGRRPEGKIIEVVKRNRSKILGLLQISKKYALVTSLGKGRELVVQIDLKDLKGAENGEKVIVEITDWGASRRKSIKGKVIEVVNEKNASDLAMKTILVDAGFELEFPDAVKREADSIKEVFTDEEISKRRDMRGEICFTIDPLTAKDFDDALSYKELEDGQIEIGVHIADVTHYVKENSPLDKEALNRTTSVYLVDRVLPMLPEKLSNNLCSLVPFKDRFTFSAIFTFDAKFKLIDRWFGKTVIHSKRRFTYEEAQDIIEAGKGDFSKELLAMDAIAKKLRKAKFKNGAIAFDAPELKFKLDDEGFPLEVFYKERKEAHLLIEDFMLLANREVATFIQKKGKDKEVPYVYRIHDTPDPERLEDFKNFALELGFKMDVSTPAKISKSFNELTKKAKEDESLKMLEPLAIRTMAKAAYSTENIGHYGLGFENYAHFTSPIRRYADVLVHRLLEKNLKKTHRTDKEKLEEKCTHISTMERKAMEAERASIKYKQIEFIKDKIGQVFDARISGMIDKGIFVELGESKAEGLISFNNMMESFSMDSNRMKITGKRTGQVLRIGDSVRVELLEVDMDLVQIELRLVE